VGWLASFAPAAFLAGVFILAVWMLITTRGMFKKLVVFALGAAIVYMLLTRVGAVADMFGSELDPDAGRAPAVVQVDDVDSLRWLG
jgi:biotin transporter BioY